MATQVDLPFQRSLLKSYLERAWTRFELVSTVKEWNAEKQVSIMPTLLWGKLVDYYVELDATTKADVKQLMMALIMIKSTSCSGSTNSSEVVHLSLSTLGWNSWRLHQSLKKLFKQAYPNEELTSAILLQCFLTGLTSPICRQLLLCGQPTTFEQAVENAKAVKYAFDFETKSTKPSTKDVNPISKPHPLKDQKLAIQLQQALNQMLKCLEALETRLQPTDAKQATHECNPPRNHRSNNRARYASIDDHSHQGYWECGELGHFWHDCPQLNYQGPARPVDSLPRK